MGEISALLGKKSIIGSPLAKRALDSAIRSQQIAVAKLLLKDYDINISTDATTGPVDPFNPSIAAPLHLAIEQQDPAMVQLLIDKGAPVGAHELSLCLVESDSVEIFQPLLDAVKDIDAYHGNATALMKAAEYARPKCARLLLDAGADLSLLARDDRTLLDYARAGGDAGLIHLIKKITSPQARPPRDPDRPAK